MVTSHELFRFESSVYLPAEAEDSVQEKGIRAVLACKLTALYEIICLPLIQNNSCGFDDAVIVQRSLDFFRYRTANTLFR